MNAKRNGAFYPVLITMITAATVVHGQGPAEDVNPAFKRLDVNRDGYVSRDEAKKLEDFEAAFSQADENGDGKLDAEEFIKAQSIYDRMRAAQFVEDSMITARIKVALLKDPQVSVLDVKVETHKGAVLLSGAVDDEKQMRRTVEIASGVRGVTAIKNSLVVKNGS